MRLLLITFALLINNACASEKEALCATEDRYEMASHFSDFVQKVNFKYAFGDIEGLSTSDVIKQVANTDQDYQEILRSFDIKSHRELDGVDYREGDDVVALDYELDFVVFPEPPVSA
ncbi:MAG: hypothetical protein COB75_07630 [Idiomarina sp.]|nr:hypothetical protein [Idiomarina sp.]PHQ74197.1 MAG: hypothetical protein COB75_07630 [Idiomarina sp.]